jgi:hypothetical protein
MLEVVFCEGFQRCLRFCLDHLNCVKMAGKKKSRRGPSQASSVGGGQQSFWFWSKIPWWKRKCVMVHCCDATASPFVAKFGAKSSHIFMQSA